MHLSPVRLGGLISAWGVEAIELPFAGRVIEASGLNGSRTPGITKHVHTRANAIHGADLVLG